MYKAENSKKAARPFFRSNVGKWLLHLTVFSIFQIIFMLTDGSPFWSFLNPNKVGEMLQDNFKPFFDQIQIYSSTHLNYVTVVWGTAVVVHGVISIVKSLHNNK
ncbi:YfzA family protein [Sporosarcina contaminans]|uniref:YfzA family protein n=1 Tax=Sporosarcina contaminans TaxID=633403 RepID=A0ABW3U3C8_9BACL